jgi:hypothetical protein
MEESSSCLITALPLNPHVYVPSTHFPIASLLERPPCSCLYRRIQEDGPLDCHVCGYPLLPAFNFEPVPPLPPLSPPSSPKPTSKATYKPKKPQRKRPFTGFRKNYPGNLAKVIMCECSENCGHLSTFR